MRGIDVSNHQQRVDWLKVAADDIHFAYARCSEGLTLTDPWFSTNQRGAQKARLPFGAYHFAHPDNRPSLVGAEAEARRFVSLLKAAGRLELPPMLDIEVGSGDLSAWADRFCQVVQAETGRKPLVYSYVSFFTAHLHWLPNHWSRWVAAFGPNDGARHPLLMPALIHQYTSNGRVNGVAGRVDLNWTDSLNGLTLAAVASPSDPEPLPEPKSQLPFSRVLWPTPIPAWFWTWARWRIDGQTYQRPLDAPAVIPPWAWARLQALQGDKP